jgi:hypothetical protein
MTSDAVHAQASLDEIRKLWPDLDSSLELGTARRWTERPDTEDEAHRRQQQDAAERLDRTPEAPGYTRAPLNITVLDTLIAETFALVELEQEIREKLGFRQVPARDAVEAAGWIGSALPALQNDPDLLEHTRREADRCARALRAALNDAEPVHPIKAGCPVCDAMSLRAFPEREVIACINPACRCGDAGCGCQDGRRHRWRATGWDWLAQVIGVQLEAADGDGHQRLRLLAADDGINSRIGRRAS